MQMLLQVPWQKQHSFFDFLYQSINSDINVPSKSIGLTRAVVEQQVMVI